VKEVPTVTRKFDDRDAWRNRNWVEILTHRWLNNFVKYAEEVPQINAGDLFYLEDD
jgi:hypothetical protein